MTVPVSASRPLASACWRVPHRRRRRGRRGGAAPSSAARRSGGELERGLVVVAEPRDRQRPPRLVVDADRLLAPRARRAALRSARCTRWASRNAVAQTIVIASARSEPLRLPAATWRCPGEMTGRVPDLLAGAGGSVEHAAQRAVAEAHQRQRDLAQLLARSLAGQVERLDRALGRVAQLLDDVRDAHLAGVRTRRRRRAPRQADRLGLAQRPAEHRVRDRLQQPLAHLAACRSG